MYLHFECLRRRFLHKHCSILQLVMLRKNKIPEERFNVFGGGINAFAQIVVVSTNQGITEIPRMIGKRFVANVEAKRAQVFDCEHCRCTGVPLTESVNLPNAGYKLGYMRDSIVDVQILIAEILLLHKIIIERFAYAVGTGIKNGFAFQHPLLLVIL